MIWQAAPNERRDNTRIVLETLAHGHGDQRQHMGRELAASLIDFPRGGAHVKLLHGSHLICPPAVGDIFLFNIRIDILDVETGAVPCQAVWVDNDELVLAFVAGLQHRDPNSSVSSD